MQTPGEAMRAYLRDEFYQFFRWLLVGSALAGVFFQWHTRTARPLLERGYATTTGTVTRFAGGITNRGCVRYAVAGRRYAGCGDWVQRHGMELGDPVTVFYLPDDPASFMARDPARAVTTGQVFGPLFGFWLASVVGTLFPVRPRPWRAPPAPGDAAPQAG